MLDEAVEAGARYFKACEVVKLSIRTVQRYRQHGEVAPDGRKAAAIGRIPGNRLSEQERTEILVTANLPAFANLPPSQIVPALADEGRYLASESSFYRILREHKQLVHRGKAKGPSHSRPQSLEATAPNQLWSWDITYLATTVKGLYFYLYLILDVFSRKIVGWEIYAEESADHAAKTFHKAHLREGIGIKNLILHSDNGSPMKGATMLGMLQKLGVVPSFSRPSVSNDNPYSESLFKTMKYRPDFPERRFDTLDQARQWAAGFTNWYNEKHHHSAIKFVTPGQRHRGEDREILTRRMLIYKKAKEKHPERWTSTCRNWDRPDVVTLNHTRKNKDQAILELKEAA
jgi:transposase InsO family protein